MIRIFWRSEIFGLHILKYVIFFLHFRLPEPNQEIETYEHFWRGTISLLHLAFLHLTLSATPNVITPNVINIVYYIWRCITSEVATVPCVLAAGSIARLRGDIMSICSNPHWFEFAGSQGSVSEFLRVLNGWTTHEDTSMAYIRFYS